MSAKREFRVLVRGASSALFPEGQTLEVDYALDGKAIKLRILTRYLDLGFAARAPGDLMIDAVGEADDVESAAASFTNAGRTIAAVIALAANAAIVPLEAEIIYETTKGAPRRAFFQRFVPADKVALTSRFIDVQGTLTLIEALAKDPERDRVYRAVAQYYEALQNWKAGNELLVMSHLFMGAEALKKALWRKKSAFEIKTKDQLATEWDYKPDGRLQIDEFLDREARLRLIFENDSDCHRKAKHVSDHFEHGFSNAPALYRDANDNVVQTAHYLRKAIIMGLDMAPAQRTLLLGDAYKRPRGPLGIDAYLKAVLIGESEHIGTEVGEFPYCDWSNTLSELSFDGLAKKYSFKPTNQFTPRMAQGLKMEEIKLELWDNSAFFPVTRPHQFENAVAEPAQAHPAHGAEPPNSGVAD